MKKILMVYPEVPVTYWSFHHVFKFIGKKAFMPPLGLLTVAALLPADWQIRLIDMNIETVEDSDLEWADLLMISAMIVQKDSFTKIVKRAKDFGLKIAAGGPYPTSSYKLIEDVDYFILNEAEITVSGFVADFEKGTPQQMYTGSEKPVLTDTPVPRFDLVDVNAYSSMSLQTSRGCPFNCEFCDIIELFGRIPRYKSPQQVTAEMEALYQTGYRGAVFIVDDNFIGNKTKVKDLLCEMVLWQSVHGYPFGLYTEASINLADEEEILDMMVDAGFNTVFVGIETPDTQILKDTGKLQNTKKDLTESVRIIQAKGIEVMAGFILGFDNEKDDIFDRQIDFITKAAIPVAMVGLMIALPLTRLYRRLQAEGRILDETSGNNTHQLDLNFKTTMPKDRLVDGYKRVIRTIYDPANYFKRSIEMIRRLPGGQHHTTKLTYNDIMTFIRSLLYQSFTAYGISYAVFMLKVLILYPNHLYAGVSLAVKGDHYFKISRDVLNLAKAQSNANKLLCAFERQLAAIIEWGNKKDPVAAAVRHKDITIRRLTSFLRMRKSPESIQSQSFKYLEESVEKINNIFENFLIMTGQNAKQS